MKMLSEKQALEKLKKTKAKFQETIKINFESKAKSCLTCETKGVCCQDAHFVNVHITKLEAVAIKKALAKFGEQKQKEIYRRTFETIQKYNLTDSGDTFSKTYSCPLFEKEIGCLVHSEAKPAPCIQHACYENSADLPPDALQTEVENQIENLNKKTYGTNYSWLPLPILLKRLDS
jgi:hypothetical protein